MRVVLLCGMLRVFLEGNGFLTKFMFDLRGNVTGTYGVNTTLNRVDRPWGRTVRLSAVGGATLSMLLRIFSAFVTMIQSLHIFF